MARFAPPGVAQAGLSGCINRHVSVPAAHPQAGAGDVRSLGPAAAWHGVCKVLTLIRTATLLDIRVEAGIQFCRSRNGALDRMRSKDILARLILVCARSPQLVPTVLAFVVAANAAMACDGRSYTFNIAVGANVSGGGLTVRLDKAKLLSDVPDKYYISVKDDGQILADHALLIQHDTISLKTRCGTVSIGADRVSIFSQGTLALNWSYF